MMSTDDSRSLSFSTFENLVSVNKSRKAKRKCIFRKVLAVEAIPVQMYDCIAGMKI